MRYRQIVKLAHSQSRKHKLFAGHTIRRLRENALLSQQALARRLGISTSYLNQIEHNQRPLTASVLVELARMFRVDVSVFSDDATARLLADLGDALTDPALSGTEIGIGELKAATQFAPNVARAVIRLQIAYRSMSDRYQALDGAISSADERSLAGSAPFPYEEVRDFFHGIGNYVDELDRRAEQLNGDLKTIGDGLEAALADRLATRHDISVVNDRTLDSGRPLRRYDRAARKLTLDGFAGQSSRIFALAHQLALIEAADAIETTLDRAALRSTAANAVCSVALANYFAGAVLLPYQKFLEAARLHRHDLGILSHVFGASIEQVCHRLSTMQRPGAHGVPFYFVRVDRAGNITKRHSATRFQFARYGGACPLWNVHEAFETPDRMLVQIAEMPDGIRYLCMAQALTKPMVGHTERRRQYAIGLGCELEDAGQVVYADSLDLKSRARIAKIGVGCRLCERNDCEQRAFPPAARSITIDQDIRYIVPYSIEPYIAKRK